MCGPPTGGVSIRDRVGGVGSDEAGEELEAVFVAALEQVGIDGLHRDRVDGFALGLLLRSEVEGCGHATRNDDECENAADDAEQPVAPRCRLLLLEGFDLGGALRGTFLFDRELSDGAVLGRGHARSWFR